MSGAPSGRADSALGDHWQRLDAFEGDQYERITTTVRVDGACSVDAFVYALKRQDKNVSGNRD